MTLFRHLNRERGITVVVVTHDMNVAAWSRRVVIFKDGLVMQDRPVEAVVPEAIRAAAGDAPVAQEARA